MQQDNTKTIEKVIRDREAKHAALKSRVEAISTERQALGYEVFANDDPKARAKLDKLNTEFANLSGETEAIAGALAEVQARRNAARADAEREIDKAKVQQIAELWGAFREAALEMDQAMASIGQTGHLLLDILSQLHQAGQRFPSHEQLNVLGAQALATCLMQTPWAKRYPHLPPRERKTFRSLIDSWSASVEADLAQRLGEQSSKKAA